VSLRLSKPEAGVYGQSDLFEGLPRRNYMNRARRRFGSTRERKAHLDMDALFSPDRHKGWWIESRGLPLIAVPQWPCHERLPSTPHKFVQGPAGSRARRFPKPALMRRSAGQ